MAWEDRSGRRYYYRKVWRAGRVQSQYIGAGRLGELAATFAVQDQAARDTQRQQRAAERARDQQLADVCELIDLLTAAALLLSGQHRHKGTWRTRREPIDEAGF